MVLLRWSESGREANLVRCVTGWENDMFPSQYFPVRHVTGNMWMDGLAVMFGFLLLGMISGYSVQSSRPSSFKCAPS